MSTPPEQITVRPAALADAGAIATIYNHYITDTIVTFEEEPVVAGEMARRMEEVRSAELPWLVAEEAGQVVGYAYATRWRPRFGYRFSVEITVYLSPEAGGRGIGSKLYGRLFSLLEARGIHAVMGGIALPNEASVALHEKFGLKQVARFEEVGFKFGRWVDVGYWERRLSGGAAPESTHRL
jgi:L-amino acid N-acyltransferase YncA